MVRSKHTTRPGADTAASKTAKASKIWGRSKFTPSEHRRMKKLGWLTDENSIRFPGDAVKPSPPKGFAVLFVAFLVRGVSLPVHDFLRGLLFVYGIQLHQLTPNSILHISIFITLCESFLGVHPNWALWKQLFFLRRTGPKGVDSDVGSVVISVHPCVEYFDPSFPENIQGWREMWFYVKDESKDGQRYGLEPFESPKIISKRISWDAEATEEEIKATAHLMEKIRALQSEPKKELSGLQIMCHFLRLRIQPCQARTNPMWLYKGAKDVDRVGPDMKPEEFDKLVCHMTRLTKKDAIPSGCNVTPYGPSKKLPKVCAYKLESFCMSKFISFTNSIFCFLTRRIMKFWKCCLLSPRPWSALRGLSFMNWKPPKILLTKKR